MAATATAPNGNRIDSIPAIVPQPRAEGAIAVFANQGNFEAAQRMAKALAASTLVPKQYQGDTGLPNVLIAMELAGRIGASPLMVMQNLYVVQGKPSWSASFLIACVNQSNRFTPLRFRWDGATGTDDWSCTCVAKDKESGEECIGARITIKLAKAEGWFGKTGSKWLTMPEQMMMYRAAAWWARVYAPELSLGMLTADEQEEIAPPPPVVVSELVPGRTVIGGTRKALVNDPPPVAPVEELPPQNTTFADDGEVPNDELPPLSPDGEDRLNEIEDDIERTSSVARIGTIKTKIQASVPLLGEVRVARLMEMVQAKQAALVGSK